MGNAPIAEESYNAAGVHRYVVLAAYSKVKIVNHDRFYQLLINIMDACLTVSPGIREWIDVIDPSHRQSSPRCWRVRQKSKNYMNVFDHTHPTMQCRLLIANVDSPL